MFANFLVVKMASYSWVMNIETHLNKVDIDIWKPDTKVPSTGVKKGKQAYPKSRRNDDGYGERKVGHEPKQLVDQTVSLVEELFSALGVAHLLIIQESFHHKPVNWLF